MCALQDLDQDLQDLEQDLSAAGSGMGTRVIRAEQPQQQASESTLEDLNEPTLEDLDRELQRLPGEDFAAGTMVVRAGSPPQQDATSAELPPQQGAASAEPPPQRGSDFPQQPAGSPEADAKEAEWADAVQAASQPQTAPAGELPLVRYVIIN